jgi:hypothetical protein
VSALYDSILGKLQSYARGGIYYREYEQRQRAEAQAKAELDQLLAEWLTSASTPCQDGLDGLSAMITEALQQGKRLDVTFSSQGRQWILSMDTTTTKEDS